MSGAPAIANLLEYECAPRIIAAPMSPEAETRLFDWIVASPWGALLYAAMKSERERSGEAT